MRSATCQGFRAKPGELLKTWDGLYVLPKFWRPRHPQDLVRAKAESLEGSPRPEPENVFIESLYPNGVSASDL